MSAFAFACALASGIACEGEARAQGQTPSIDTRTWRPSTDPNASVIIEPAITPGPGVLSVGAYTHYSLQPVTLRRAGTDDVAFRPVSHVFGIDPVVNLGIGQRLAFGATLPVLLYQTGSSNLPPTVSNEPQVPHTTIGDLGLTVKGTLIRNEGGGFGLAGLGLVSLPTGNKSSFAGEGSVTASVRLLAEYTLLVAAVQASIGYKLRTDHQTWPAQEAGGYRFGDEIPWTFGFGFRPGVLGVDSGNRQRWEVALHGWLPAGPVGPFGTGDPGSSALSPLMITASDRIELGHYRDAYVLVGADFGLNDAVGVPIVRAIASIGWAPREHDMDHDGVKDDVDGCPEIPEDKDGFEDSDGCPEIDNDDDGILDKEDACPNVAGVESKDPKKNGCPIPDQDGDGIEDSLDACPQVKGEPSDDPKKNGCPEEKVAAPVVPEKKCDRWSDPTTTGCPNPDRDGDTFDNEVDKCPDQAEVWNGVTDEDGCPDEGGAALVTIDDKRVVRLAKPIKIAGTPDDPEVDPSSLPTVHALAAQLNQHRNWTLAVGAKPGPGDATKAQLDALSRSFAVVREVASLSHRDGVAETVGWDAVKKQAQADGNLGFLVLVNPTP